MSTRVIVDKDDNVIQTVDRSDFNSATDIYRVSGLWVTNGQGEVLLAQRSFSKTNGAGQWGPAVAGTVEEGETYLSNIIKETEEEIGVIDIQFTEGPKVFWDGSRKFFCQWYSAIIDKPADEFSVSKDEVEQVAWVGLDTLNNELESNPDKYIPSMKNVPEIYLNG